MLGAYIASDALFWPGLCCAVKALFSYEQLRELGRPKVCFAQQPAPEDVVPRLFVLALCVGPVSDRSDWIIYWCVQDLDLLFSA